MVGRLAADPELRTTQSGLSTCSFRVACQRRFKNQQTGQYEADFITCVAWRQTAEFVCKYYQKGSGIALVGTIQNRSYEAQDGQKRYVTEVIVDNVEFPPKGANNGQHEPYGAAGAQQSEPKLGPPDSQGFQEVLDDTGDELPF